MEQKSTDVLTVQIQQEDITLQNTESLNDNLDNGDKYEAFKAWIAKEGVIMPKVCYPAVFENGLVGVKSTERIESGEAMIMVPYKMVMSVGKARAHPVLKVIFEQNENVLTESDEDYKLLALAIFLMYETTLGKDSYWYPYLR